MKVKVELLELDFFTICRFFSVWTFPGLEGPENLLRWNYGHTSAEKGMCNDVIDFVIERLGVESRIWIYTGFWRLASGMQSMTIRDHFNFMEEQLSSVGELDNYGIQVGTDVSSEQSVRLKEQVGGTIKHSCIKIQVDFFRPVILKWK